MENMASSDTESPIARNSASLSVAPLFRTDPVKGKAVDLDLYRIQ